MTRTRRIGLVVLVLASACVVVKPIGDADTEATSSGTDDESATATATDSNSGPGMTSMADTTTGEPDTDLRRVDCAEQDWGPTVGGGELGPLGFPIQACNPRESGEAFGYKCCSTDPATADGRLPAYEGKQIPDSSTPIYADAANDAGTWGMCVRRTNIPLGSGLISDEAENCPIPCDPTWADDDVTAVCGQGRVCCQTTELGEKDCVQEDGVWRPVSGEDIGHADPNQNTVWNNAAHDTHQDPNGNVCLAVAEGDPGSEVFRDCIQTLSVANKRGFCMALQPGQICPEKSPSYQSACDLLNE